VTLRIIPSGDANLARGIKPSLARTQRSFRRLEGQIAISHVASHALLLGSSLHGGHADQGHHQQEHQGNDQSGTSL
jgi:hypothetical protein